jgi:hypothetical protein
MCPQPCQHLAKKTLFQRGVATFATKICSNQVIYLTNYLIVLEIHSIFRSHPMTGLC